MGRITVTTLESDGEESEWVLQPITVVEKCWDLVLSKLRKIVIFLNYHADSMLVSFVGMALYTGYVFMPQHIMAILHYFEIVQ